MPLLPATWIEFARRHLPLAALSGALLGAGCAGSIQGLNVHRGPGELLPDQPRFNDTLQIRYLGAGGFLLRCGANALLTAPFYSAPGLLRVSLFPLEANTNRIRRLLPNVKGIDALLVGHAHYDHLLDIPCVIQEHATNAVVYGNSTMSNLLRAVVSPARLAALDGTAGEFRSEGRPGPWITVSGGRIRFMALRSEHAPHFAGIKLFTGEVRAPRSRLPCWACGWKEGQTLAFLIDFLKENGTIRYRILYQDAAVNCPPYGGLPALDPADQKSPDVAILCLASAGEAKNYPEGLIRSVCPGNVIVGHWEDFFRSQLRPLRVIRLTSGPAFMKRLSEVHPAERTFLPAPGAWMNFDESRDRSAWE